MAGVIEVAASKRARSRFECRREWSDRPPLRAENSRDDLIGGRVAPNEPRSFRAGNQAPLAAVSARAVVRVNGVVSGRTGST